MKAIVQRWTKRKYFCSMMIKALTSGTHFPCCTGLGTGSAPGPIETGPGTKPVGTLCQPSIDIPNVNT